MSKLSILLGAGFSVNAGFPLAQAVNDRFNRDQKGKLLKMSSSEWFWEDGKSDTVIHNGKMFTDSNYYSYVLDEVIKKYKEDNNGFTDYEDLFQYILDNSTNKNWYQNIQEISFQCFLNDHPYLNSSEGLEYLELCKTTHFSRIIEIINHLVADLLFVQIKPEAILNFYLPFVNYIKQFDEVSIFTLNHDLLLESIFDYFNITYSRGFSEKNSPIYFENSALPVFNDNFNGYSIRILKLHGSIDYYSFLNIDNSQFNGKYNYFTTKGYRAKHYAKRVNLETGQILQEFNSDIVPKFITGKNKPNIIKNDFMFSSLYDHFQNEISQTENLLISGYSFNDKHINLELEKRSDLNIINQRKTKNYPFEGNIRNIDSFENL